MKSGYNQSNVMNWAAIFTLVLTLVAAILLISERFRPDLIALIVLVILGLGGIVGPEEIFSGFSGSAVITILGISIISEALHQTGVANLFSRWMNRVSRGSERRMIVTAALSAAALSLFMNNIAAAGILLPAVMTLSRRNHIAPGRLLMPLAFGTILGGMATLLTTSNIIVSDALQEAGYRSYGLLDFFPIGAPLVVAGAVYLATAGRRLLPAPDTGILSFQQLGARLTNLYDINKNLTELEVMQGSPLADKTLAEGEWARRTGLNVVGVMRNGHGRMATRRTDLVKVGDRVVVQGDPGEAVLDRFSLRPTNIVRINLPEMMDATVSLGELIVAPHSNLIGRTLRTANFREKYKLTVLAIWRSGQPVQTGIADIPLQFGDALLVQGSADRIHLLRDEPELILLEEDPDAVIRPGKTGVTLAITLLALAVAASGFLPVAQVVLAGAVMLVLVQSLSMADLYRSVEWRAVFVIAGMWPLSIAIRDTGLAASASQALLGVLSGWHPLLVVMIFLLVCLIITQLMSGQVAALVLAPLAIATAEQLGVDPRGLGMAIALGCSLAFITPFGHPVNIMVMSSGGYRIRDFLRVGLPLTVIVIVLILVGLRIFWGF